MPTDQREFDSPDERQEFLERSLSDVVVNTAPDGPSPRDCHRPFGRYVGREVWGVEFVADYFQVVLEDARVSVEAWPIVTAGTRPLLVGAPGYADALIGLIGQRLISSDVYLDAGVVLSFSTTELRFSPEQVRDSEYPELVTDEVWAEMPPFDEPAIR